MTDNILRLRDALNRDRDDSRLRERLAQNSSAIQEALHRSGEYRLRTDRGTIVIRSVKPGA